MSLYQPLLADTEEIQVRLTNVHGLTVSMPKKFFRMDGPLIKTSYEMRWKR